MLHFFTIWHVTSCEMANGIPRNRMALRCWNFFFSIFKLTDLSFQQKKQERVTTQSHSQPLGHPQRDTVSNNGAPLFYPQILLKAAGVFLLGFPICSKVGCQLLWLIEHHILFHVMLHLDFPLALLCRVCFHQIILIKNFWAFFHETHVQVSVH